MGWEEVPNGMKLSDADTPRADGRHYQRLASQRIDELEREQSISLSEAYERLREENLPLYNAAFHKDGRERFFRAVEVELASGFSDGGAIQKVASLLRAESREVDLDMLKAGL